MSALAQSLLRPTRTSGAAVALALALTLAGCADDSRAPTGPEAPSAGAAAVAAPLVFRSVSAGDSHTCGVTRDNRAWCWGSNFNGQLGDGTTATDHVLPAPVAGGLSFRTVTVGNDHSCGITTDELAYCWGTGALGDGNHSAAFSANRSPSPAGIASPSWWPGRATPAGSTPTPRPGAGATTTTASSATLPASARSRPWP